MSCKKRSGFVPAVLVVWLVQVVVRFNAKIERHENIRAKLEVIPLCKQG